MCQITPCSFCHSDIVGDVPMEIESRHPGMEGAHYFCPDCLSVFYGVVMSAGFKKLMELSIEMGDENK